MMLSSRAADFQRALRTYRGGAQPAHWTDVAEDPNDVRNLIRRAEVLQAAWRPPMVDRIKFLQDRCHDRHVLDIGCVGHSANRMTSASWLHANLARVAARCVGVDIVAEGVDSMLKEGYTAIEHDLTKGIGPLADNIPFDVIVAGELIEHLTSLDMIFRTAVDALSPDGELIITTPNPYAPRRVRAGQLGLIWENVDHILYAFPSGMAELCERHGLCLTEAMTTDDNRRPRRLDPLRAVRRHLLARRRSAAGLSTLGALQTQRVGDRHIGLRYRMLFPKRVFLGETFIYVIRRPAADQT